MRAAAKPHWSGRNQSLTHSFASSVAGISQQPAEAPPLLTVLPPRTTPPYTDQLTFTIVSLFRVTLLFRVMLPYMDPLPFMIPLPFMVKLLFRTMPLFMITLPFMIMLLPKIMLPFMIPLPLMVMLLFRAMLLFMIMPLYVIPPPFMIVLPFVATPLYRVTRPLVLPSLFTTLLMCETQPSYMTTLPLHLHAAALHLHLHAATLHLPLHAATLRLHLHLPPPAQSAHLHRAPGLATRGSCQESRRVGAGGPRRCCVGMVAWRVPRAPMCVGELRLAIKKTREDERVYKQQVPKGLYQMAKEDLRTEAERCGTAPVDPRNGKEKPREKLMTQEAEQSTTTSQIGMDLDPTEEEEAASPDA